MSEPAGEVSDMKYECRQTQDIQVRQIHSNLLHYGAAVFSMKLPASLAIFHGFYFVFEKTN